MILHKSFLIHVQIFHCPFLLSFSLIYHFSCCSSPEQTVLAKYHSSYTLVTSHSISLSPLSALLHKRHPRSSQRKLILIFEKKAKDMLFHTDAHNHPGGIKRLNISGPATGNSDLYLSLNYVRMARQGSHALLKRPIKGRLAAAINENLGNATTSMRYPLEGLKLV